jgi:type IV secretory pathway VirB10-like protein
MSENLELPLLNPVDRAAATPPLQGGQAPLNTRVDEPKPVKIRLAAVMSILGGAAIIMCGAVIFVFVLDPFLKVDARAKAREESQRTPTGSVKPADVLSNHPVTYADLTKADTNPPIEDADIAPDIHPIADAGPAHPSRVIVDRAPSESRYLPSNGASRTSAQSNSGPNEVDLARKSGLFFGEPVSRAALSTASAPMPSVQTDQPSVARKSDYQEVYGDRAILTPVSPYELKAGTVIPAALLTAIDTQREGRIVALVTENVFDTVSGQYLLIPQGARMLGRFDGDQTYGERRAFLVWERIIFADGRSISLNKEPGVDSAGAGGVTGRVDRRLVQLVVASLFSGAITTLGEAARRDGDGKSSSFMGDAGDAASIEAARVGGRLIDRELEVKPTIRIAQGSRVQVLLTRDLILEPAP